jgi:hypothetical protein
MFSVYFSEETGKKLFLTLGQKACFVDKFSRCVPVTARRRTLSEAKDLIFQPALTRLTQSDPFSDSFVNITKSTLRNKRTFPDQSSLREQMNDSVLDSQDAIYKTILIISGCITMRYDGERTLKGKMNGGV